jgi:mannosyltransferase
MPPLEADSGARPRGKVFLVLFVSALGLATAFYQLGFKGLWGDEVWQVGWANQQSLAETFVRFTIFTPAAHPRAPSDLDLPAQTVSLDNDPLSFLWTHLTTRLGTSEFWVRFPSAVFGAASVLILFLLASRLFGRRAGLLASVTLALAPYHVWYAQDARAYAGLIFWSLLGLYFLAASWTVRPGDLGWVSSWPRP